MDDFLLPRPVARQLGKMKMDDLQNKAPVEDNDSLDKISKENCIELNSLTCHLLELS